MRKGLSERHWRPISGETGRHYAPGDVVADWPDFGQESLVVGIDTNPWWFGGYGVMWERGGATAVGVLRNGNCRVAGP
jgi:hypothetical protein